MRGHPLFYWELEGLRHGGRGSLGNSRLGVLTKIFIKPDVGSCGTGLEGTAEIGYWPCGHPLFVGYVNSRGRRA